MLNIQSLAYIVVESAAPDRWRHFGEDMLGMTVSPAADGGLGLKMDERDFRLLIVPGSEDRYLASAWQAVDAAAFEASVEALKGAGVAVEPGSAAMAESRRVERLALFGDAAGNRHELVLGYTGGSAPFRSPLGLRYKTGVQGMGHTVLPAIPFEPTLALFKDTLGFGLSDVFNFKPMPDAPNVRIYFLHAAAGRHHSLALAEMPNPAGCVHVMVEVDQLTDVGRAYDRMAQQGIKLMATLGEHENDRMTSFYMMTPGNFAMEFGWGGIDVDPGSWETTQTQQVSIWGHDFSVGFR